MTRLDYPLYPREPSCFFPRAQTQRTTNVSFDMGPSLIQLRTDLNTTLREISYRGKGQISPHSLTNGKVQRNPIGLSPFVVPGSSSHTPGMLLPASPIQRPVVFVSGPGYKTGMFSWSLISFLLLTWSLCASSQHLQSPRSFLVFTPTSTSFISPPFGIGTLTHTSLSFPSHAHILIRLVRE